MLIRTFQILAVVLIGVAAYFFSQGDKDAVFVSAVFAVCSFFMSVRFQTKNRIDARRAAEAAFSDDNLDPESKD